MRGVEPPSRAWEARVIAVIRHPLKQVLILRRYCRHRTGNLSTGPSGCTILIMTNTREYTRVGVVNPFDAPVYFTDETDSTMIDARILAERGEPDGTVIFAGMQTAGRGRIAGRVWESVPHESLLCTVIFRRKPDPVITLRTGLAVAQTYSRFIPSRGDIAVKWPNDVLFRGKKLAGILCESDGSTILVAAGLNLAQKSFPEHLADKASSLRLAREAFSGQTVFPSLPLPADVLPVFLTELSSALAEPFWNRKLSSLLWKRNEPVRFVSGDPDTGETVNGTVSGIGQTGELLISTGSAEAPGVRSFWSGEISY